MKHVYFTWSPRNDGGALCPLCGIPFNYCRATIPFCHDCKKEYPRSIENLVLWAGSNKNPRRPITIPER